jgi:class 3 adenylate cyclase
MLGRYTTGPRGQGGYHRVFIRHVTKEAQSHPYTEQAPRRRLGADVSEEQEAQSGLKGGTPGAAGPAAPHTDLRTFMIADIRGYTTYTREHGDEAGAVLASQFGEIVADVVPRHEGFLVELRGDEALVVFVSARKALRAAVELQDRFASLPRGVGIGLDAGEAIPVGAGYRGTSLNLAARLSGQAAAGETLASEAVIHLAAKMDGIAYVDARDLKLKGYAEAVRAVVVIPADRAKGHRLASDRRNAGRPRFLFGGLAVVAAMVVIVLVAGNALLNGNLPPTVTPSPPASLLADASPSGQPSATPEQSASPFELGRLPVLAFYDANSGDLKTTTQVASPTNISFFGGGSFWILSEAQGSRQFLRVDPTTHEISQRVNVPLDESNGFNFDDDYIWVTDLAGPRVFRLDQRSGTYTTFSFGEDDTDTAAAVDIAVGAGSVWLARPDKDNGEGRDRGEITRLNRVNGQVEKRIEADAFGMSFGADALWFGRGDALGRVDPATNRVALEPVTLSPGTNIGNIYIAGGDAWTAMANSGAVYRLDRSGRFSRYDLEPGVGEMAPTETTMWVTNSNTGALTGIDLATGSTDRVIDPGHAVIATAAGAGEIMIAVGPTVDEAIADIPGSVLKIATDGIPWWDPAPDPAVSGNWAARQGFYLTCANLVTYREVAGVAGFELVPEVAAEMPSLSADRRTYAFTIRPDFKFSPPSNEVVTAETFRHTLERALSPIIEDGPGPQFFSDIVGVEEYRSGATPNISGIEVSDNVLSITLREPAPDFLDRLAQWVACAVPISGTPALRSGLNPDPPMSGAGPYYLAEKVRKRLVVFKKNPNYHGPRAQPFDAIAIRMLVAPANALAMVERGQVDAVIFEPGVPLTGATSELAAALGPKAPGDQRWFGAARSFVDFLALNPSRPAFADPDVREAVALALDRTEVADIFVNGPTAELLVPSVRGSQNAEVAAPDLERARALMNGRHLDATMVGLPDDCGPCTDFELALVRQLGAIGITLTFRDEQEFPDGAYSPGSEADLVVWGTGNFDTPDPVDHLGGLHDVAWVGSDNLAELDRLDGLSGQDRVDGAVAFAHNLVNEQFLVVPLQHPVFPFYISERLSCTFIQPALGAVDLLSLCPKDAGATPSSSP